MSQFRLNSLKTVAIIAILSATAPAASANAAYSTNHSRAMTQTHSAPLSAFQSQTEKFVIDWRSPSKTITFDAPDTDFITSAKLFLSADPSRNNARGHSLFIQFNQEAPTEIKSTGRGFDAQLKLQTAKMKTKNNTIRLYVQAPTDANCAAHDDSAWVVDLDNSKIALTRQAKSQSLKVGDVENILGNPLTTPQSVSLYTRGEDVTALQSLLAQGVGQRMEGAPKFTTLKGKGDFQIIAGRRDQISSFIKDKSILAGTGARLGFDEGRPSRLIFTGDTDAEVLALARAFSQYELPRTKRLSTTIGEIHMQKRFSEKAPRISGKTKLSALGNTAFEAGWNPADEVYEFNLSDPAASEGQVTLELASSETALSANNAISLRLNDHVIGHTRLDQPRKTASFSIPSGLLRGQKNELRLSADLNADAEKACNGLASPGVYLKSNSQLILTSNNETPLSDLSRFAATGAPFSDANGRDTLIILPRNNSDYNAALAVIAKLAESQAEGWNQAQFIRGTAKLEAYKDNKNILFILPSTELPSIAKHNAPKTVRSALRGHRYEGQDLLQVKSEQYAGTNAQAAYQAIAQKAKQRNSVRLGGVAALYSSPYQSDKMVGVITNVPGQSFPSTLQSLLSEDHWNAIEGSVARWSDKSVFMAELSAPLIGFSRSISPSASSGKSGLNFSNFDLPEINLPHFAIPNWDLPKVSLPVLSSITASLPRFDFELPNIDGTEILEKLTFWKTETPSTETQSTKPNISITEYAEAKADAGIKTSSRPTLPLDYNDYLRKASASPQFDAPSPPSQSQSFLEAALPDSQITIREANVSTTPANTALNWVGNSWTTIKQKISAWRPKKDIQNMRKSAQSMAKTWRSDSSRLSGFGTTQKNWTNQSISVAALLLILAVGVLAFLLGASSPKSRNGKQY